jgi:2-polyprenyl-3-methyl-5-hydroxy-6-metoxy-1,4-benzoquinol methylase
MSTVAPSNTTCVACGGDAVEFLELVSVTDVARLWVRDFRERGRDEIDEASLAGEIRETLGSDTIQFDKCRACGVEMAWPARSWVEGQYPSDQLYPVRWEFAECLADFGVRAGRILELGCGSGTFLEMAREAGHEGFGMDFNPIAVEAAREKGLQVVQGGFDDLLEHLRTCGERSQFDAVAMFHVIEHLESPSNLFEALAAFVHEQSHLFISCPGPNRYTRLLREICVGSSDYWDFPPHHVLRWTESSLGAFLRRSGWEPVRFVEEPLNWIGASAEIGCLRAIEGGYMDDPVRRRLAILWARLRLRASRKYGSGVSVYLHAIRS